MTRSGTFTFADYKQTGNFQARVRTGGGGFTNEVGESIEVIPGDILMKLGDDSPWFALFRDPVVVEQTEETTAAPEGTEDQAPQLHNLETKAEAEGIEPALTGTETIETTETPADEKTDAPQD